MIKHEQILKPLWPILIKNQNRLFSVTFKPNIKRWTDMLFEREAFKKVINYKYDGPGPSGPEEL